MKTFSRISAIIILLLMTENLLFSQESCEFKYLGAKVDSYYFPNAIMLVPVKLNNEFYYMQLDNGTPHSAFYIDVLPKEFQESINIGKTHIDYTDFVFTDLSDHNMTLSYLSGHIYNDSMLLMHEPTNLDHVIWDKMDHQIIGTLGSDITERFISIDYQKKRIAVDESPSKREVLDSVKLKLGESNNIYLPINYQGEQYHCLFDTGSSLFSLLLTNKGIEIFNLNKLKFAEFDVGAWGNPVAINHFTDLSDTILIGNTLFEVSELFGCKNDGFLDFNYENKEIGILGNRLFLNRKIIIDYKREWLYLVN